MTDMVARERNCCVFLRYRICRYPCGFQQPPWHPASEGRIVQALQNQAPMATPKPFPHAGFLSQLEHINASASVPAATRPPSLARVLLIAEDSGRPTPAAVHLVHLLKARKAMLQASFDTEVVADELRRYQKFAQPGQPSPHTVQLRQQQAAARQASHQSKQSFIKAAAAFVRETGIEVSPRMALEAFIIGWIEAHVPKDVITAT